MAHESFEDTDVAALLNDNYVAIKVDREERPDIDAVYMSACQSMTGQGGWPLTIIMTPEQKPFYAATYLPKAGKHGSIGLIELLTIVYTQWKENNKEIIASSNQITAFLQEQAIDTSDQDLYDLSMIHESYLSFKRIFDKKNGGFGSAPKFPTPHNLLFLLYYSQIEKNSDARSMAVITLEQMYRGGIFDHIDGGFSRYSTDKKWLVPHFEKMLYDNALLTLAYLDAYSITKNSLFKWTTEKILAYVSTELTDGLGGFYCGQDADSEGIEGKYYVFTPEEIKDVLGVNEGNLFNSWYGITDKGNFEGKNIPNLLLNPDYAKINNQVNLLLPKLSEYRKHRTSLHKDDKVLTSWNGLMIAALSKAYCILNKQEYLSAAKKCQEFIEENLTDSNGRLMVSWREGTKKENGQLDDYAFYGLSLVELYQSTFDVKYLKAALVVAEQLIDYFYDKSYGGFFIYANDSEQLITKPKDVYDGAIPSGNSAAASVLLSLYRLTGEKKWSLYVEKQMQFLSNFAIQYPTGCSFALLSLMSYLYPSKELICVVSDTASLDSLIQYLNKLSKNNLSILIKTPDNAGILEKIAPFTGSYPFPKSGNAYYLCENQSCKSPVFSLDEIPLQ